MPVLSDSILAVTLPSGNRAVYSVPPNHVNDRPGTTLAERARDYGTLLATQFGADWYRPTASGMQLIDDNRTITLLNRATEA
jgi:hypothetical protein